MWVAALIAIPAMPAITADFSEQQQLIDKAQMTIEAFGADPNLKTALQTEVKDPKGIFIVPQLLRGAFVFGGKGGSGALLIRDEKIGAWSQRPSYTPKQIPIAHSRR
jgi:SH3 domain-containing YSC84-like protein 1